MSTYAEFDDVWGGAVTKTRMSGQTEAADNSVRTMGEPSGSSAAQQGGSTSNFRGKIPRWLRTLETQSEAFNGELRAAVAMAHENTVALTATAASASPSGGAALTCTLCRKQQYKLDVVDFLCCPENRPEIAKYEGPEAPHRFCTKCMMQLLRSHQKSLAKRLRSPTGGKEEEDNITFLMELIKHKVDILPCPLCKTPNVLTVRIQFNEGFERTRMEPNGQITRYHVDLSATRLLSQNFYVEAVFENQRRPIFGAFSKDNLLATDWRGKFSTKEGSELPAPFSEVPNKAWVWIERFAPDETLRNTGTNGWQYRRFGWGAKDAEYDKNISLFHFVRRRRVLHTRIRLNDQVKPVLQRLASIVGGATWGDGGAASMVRQRTMSPQPERRELE